MHLILLLLAFAQADDRIFDATRDEPRTLVMVMPDMAKNVLTAIRVGGGVPTQLGVRALLYAYRNDKIALAFEGFAQGYSVGENGLFSMADSYGGGFRVELPVVSDGDNDALMVAPGVDFMFVGAGTHNGGWNFGHTPYTNVYFLGTNVDVSWLHMFARHFGIELGAQAGLDVSLGGRDGSNAETAGKVYPKLTLFGGFRF